MKKRLITALLASVLAVQLIPTAAMAEETAASDEYRITDEDVTINLVRSDNSNQPMQLDNEVLQAVQDYTGVTLDINAIAGSDWGTKTEMLIATNSDYDIMYDCAYVSTYASQGAFLDFSQYMDIMPNISALFEEYPELNNLYIDGALYQIPVLSRYAYRYGRSPMIRQDYLDETGMDMPTNYDELYEVLLAIKENHPDIYPIGNRNNTANLWTCYAYSFGTGFEDNGVYYEPTTGQYEFGPLSDEFTTMLEWFANAYADGLLDPDYAVTTSTNWQENMSSGYNCFFYDNPTFASNFNLVLAAEDENSVFAPMEVPASGDTKRGLFYSLHDMGATVVSADTENPEVVCKFLDFLYSDFGCDLTNFGIEGETFEYNEEGIPEVLDSVAEEYMSASDPMRAFLGDYSLQKLGIARYIDERDQTKFMTDEALEWYTLWESWDFMDEPVTKPSFTSEENDELADLITEVTDTLEMSYDDFIMGKRPISEWSQVQDEIRESAERICEIYNTAAAR